MKGSRGMKDGETTPPRIGAIDVGSNALRFMAVEVAASDTYEVLETGRVPLRLGHDVFLTGRMHFETVDRAMRGLSEFVERLSALGITRYRAVATSAVRQSKNGASFVERVANELGLKLEVINGSEEARLVFLAVRTRVPVRDGEWVLVDLGGGSVEVSVVNGGAILWTESRSIGSVRLLEELTGSNDDPGRFNAILSDYVSALNFRTSGRPGSLSGLIATGGNIESLSKLADATERWPGVAQLPLDRLQSVTRRLIGMSYVRRVNELGLREDRADVILPAALVYSRVAEVAGAKEILVPFVGVKEGIIEDLLLKLAGEVGGADADRQVWDAAVNLGRKYLFEEAHGLQVARLSLSLFDQLSKELELPRDDRRLLVAAAILHDVGVFISYAKHHKHSLYLIAQAELTGFSAHELLLVGQIARYHRKSSPSTKHLPFARLSEADRNRVSRLAGLLRLADSLDRDHSQRIDEVVAGVEGETVRLRVKGSGDLLLEMWSLEKKSRLFTRTFGLNVAMTPLSAS